MTAEQRLVPVSTFKPELASFNGGASISPFSTLWTSSRISI